MDGRKFNMFSNKRTDDLFDKVDAIFFTGDSLFNREDIAEAQRMLTRWSDRLQEIIDIVEEIDT